MSPLLIALISAVGTLGAAYLTYRLRKRLTSGNIETSSAVELWGESAKMREELRDEIVGLRKELAESHAQIAHLLDQIRLSNEAVSAARAETSLLRAETQMLRNEIARLHAEVTTGNALTLGALADNAEFRSKNKEDKS